MTFACVISIGLRAIVCLSYKNTIWSCDLLSGDLNRQLPDAIKSQNTVSLVGDNINFTTNVRAEWR
jgi:hypothetical protein